MSNKKGCQLVADNFQYYFTQIILSNKEGWSGSRPFWFTMSPVSNVHNICIFWYRLLQLIQITFDMRITNYSTNGHQSKVQIVDNVIKSSYRNCVSCYGILQNFHIWTWFSVFRKFQSFHPWQDMRTANNSSSSFSSSTKPNIFLTDIDLHDLWPDVRSPIAWGRTINTWLLGPTPTDTLL